MITFLITIFCLCSGLCVWLWPQHFGGKWTSLVFLTGIFFYLVSIPLESEILGYSRLIVGHQTVILSDSFKEVLLLSASLAIIGFTLGIRLLNLFRPREGQARSLSPKGSFHAPMILLVGGSFLIIAFFKNELGTIGSYSGNVRFVYNNAIYSFLVLTTTIAIGVMSTLLILRKRRLNFLSVTLVGVLLAWGVFSSDKDPILIAGISAGAAFLVGRVSRITAIAVLPFVLLVAAVASILFSINRSESRQRVDLLFLNSIEIVNTGLFRHLDPAGPIVSIDAAVSQSSLLWGETYISSLYNWIPRGVWESRPLDIAESSARELMPNWQPGQGMGYSPIAESYINFGIVGAFIQFFIYGLFWGGSLHLLAFAKTLESQRFWMAVYWVAGCYLLFMLNRGSMAMFTKTALQIGVPIGLAWFLFDRMSWRGLLFAKQYSSSGRRQFANKTVFVQKKPPSTGD